MDIEGVDSTSEGAGWEPSSRSRNFLMPGPPFPHGRIGGIAGINTSLAQNEFYAKKVQQWAQDYQIDWTYNASHSFPLDLCESFFFNYNGYSTPAKLLIALWTQFADTGVEGAKYLQICHSQGAIHVRNALARCPEEVRNRVVVVAIAPGVVIPKSLCFASYNYASKRDGVPYGQIATSGFFAPDNDERMLQHWQDLRELVWLDPHPNAPFFDHSFESPTFEEVIRGHIEGFLVNGKFTTEITEKKEKESILSSR
jgi:hypothetical protein